MANLGYFRRTIKGKASLSWHIPSCDMRCVARGLACSFLSPGIDVRRMSVITQTKPGQWFYKDQLASTYEIRSRKSVDDVAKQGSAVSFLEMVMKIDHANVAKFFGLHWIPTGSDRDQTTRVVLIVSEMGGKGHLEDLLLSDVSQSWELRFAIIADILQGLMAIHRSALRFHEALTISSVTITKRFGALIDDAARERLRNILKGEIDVELTGYPWIAPEQVATGVTTENAVMGNIFSLGVILQEIATRGKELDPLKAGNGMDQEETHIPPDLLSVIQQCCSVNPTDRPTLQQVSLKLRSCLPRGPSSLIDRLTARLSHYNQELEQVVYDRQKNLLEEMKRVDDILAELLPREVISLLRKSEVVEPQYFPSVSVMFSGIPVFDQIAKASPPLIIINMLEDLYTTTDNLLPRFECYKVESIRDQYMIASGVPIATGSNHALELAELALSMMLSIQKLQEKYFSYDYQLQLRIGIHSGPCVAGIVGHKLPHYTLFGDTVNTASRMESTSEGKYGIRRCVDGYIFRIVVPASRIQVSSSTRAMVLFRDALVLTSRGFIDIKGKGNVETFWLSHRGHLGDLL